MLTKAGWMDSIHQKNLIPVAIVDVHFNFQLVKDKSFGYVCIYVDGSFGHAPHFSQTVLILNFYGSRAVVQTNIIMLYRVGMKHSVTWR